MGEDHSHEHSGHNMILVYFFGPFVAYCCLANLIHLFYCCFCKKDNSSSNETEKQDDLLNEEIKSVEDETYIIIIKNQSDKKLDE